MCHSFVKWLRKDLVAGFNPHADTTFQLRGTANMDDLPLISRSKPDIVILEIGANDLAILQPETVGLAIEELARCLVTDFEMKTVAVRQVILRGLPYPDFESFNESVKVLNSYLSTTLNFPRVLCWKHKGF